MFDYNNNNFKIYIWNLLIKPIVNLYKFLNNLFFNQLIFTNLFLFFDFLIEKPKVVWYNIRSHGLVIS